VQFNIKLDRNVNDCATSTRYKVPYVAIPYWPALQLLTTNLEIYSPFSLRRRDRVAEGGGLLNRYTSRRGKNARLIVFMHAKN
jgi:hypothetical protein